MWLQFLCNSYITGARDVGMSVQCILGFDSTNLITMIPYQTYRLIHAGLYVYCCTLKVYSRDSKVSLCLQLLIFVLEWSGIIIIAISTNEQQ